MMMDAKCARDAVADGGEKEEDFDRRRLRSSHLHGPEVAGRSSSRHACALTDSESQTVSRARPCRQKREALHADCDLRRFELQSYRMGLTHAFPV